MIEAKPRFRMLAGKRLGVMRPAHPDLAVPFGAYVPASESCTVFSAGLPTSPGPYTFVGWLSMGGPRLLDYQARVLGPLEKGDALTPMAHEGQFLPSIGQVFHPPTETKQ